MEEGCSRTWWKWSLRYWFCQPVCCDRLLWSPYGYSQRQSKEASQGAPGLILADHGPRFTSHEMEIDRTWTPLQNMCQTRPQRTNACKKIGVDHPMDFPPSSSPTQIRHPALPPRTNIHIPHQLAQFSAQSLEPVPMLAQPYSVKKRGSPVESAGKTISL